MRLECCSLISVMKASAWKASHTWRVLLDRQFLIDLAVKTPFSVLWFRIIGQVGAVL